MATFPRLTIAGFLFSLVAGIGLVVQPTKVYAADNLTVSITSFTAESISSTTDSAGKNVDKNLVIKGQVQGIPASAGQKLELALTISDSIRTRSAISDALANPSDVVLRENSQTQRIIFNSTLNSDGSAEWSTEFPASDVLREAGNGVYALGISATADQGSGTTSLMFPWFPDQTSLDPTAISLIVPLTVFNKAPLGTHTPNDDERSELDRISNLVSIDQKLAAAVTWAIDPALNEWLDALDDDQARALKAHIAEMRGSRIALPYGLADVDALSQNDLKPELADLVSITGEQSANIYFTTQDKFDPAALLKSDVNKNFIPVLANSDFGVSANSTLEAASQTNTLHVLTFDRATSDCFKQTETSDLVMSQCVASQVAMMTAEQPNRSRSIALVAPINWNSKTAAFNKIISSMTQQNWVTLTSITSQLNFTDAHSMSYSHNATTGSIPAKNVKVTRALTTKADALAEVIDNPEFVRTYKQLVARTFSTHWSNQATAYQFGKTNLKNLQTLADSIAITTSPSITIGSESASLPITVVNSSGYDVTVRVALTSTSPARFAPQTSDDIAIKNGQKVTVAIPITVYGAGRLSVSAALVSSHGKVVGTAQQIVITPTAYTRFASTIVIGALGLLVLLVIVRLVRRRLSDRKEMP